MLPGRRVAADVLPVDGVLVDLGVSSPQLDEAERGFSFNKDGPLDMRMGRQELTAAQILNTYSKADLARILRTYGEERFADPALQVGEGCETDASRCDLPADGGRVGLRGERVGDGERRSDHAVALA